MNHYEALIFPKTDIFRKEHYPLLLFFTPLHFLQIADPNITNSQIYKESQHFLENGMIKPHIPAPLGENRLQFLRLVGYISERREHCFTKIKKLFTALEPSPVDTRNLIVSFLLQEFDIKHQKTEKDLELWRARLVLAMAEILDSDQENVREKLSEQDYFNAEITALSSLPEAKGTDEIEFQRQLEDMVAKLEEPQLKNSVNRVEAWLHLMKNQPLPPVKVWVAIDRDSGEYLFTRYKSISNTSPVPILKLAFPSYIDASAKYVVEYIEKFQNETRIIHRGLVEDFEKIIATVPYLRDSHESLLPYGIDWAEQWEEMLDEFFPASAYGRRYSTFFLFPNQSINQLLSMVMLPDASHDQAAHGLLCVLGPS